MSITESEEERLREILDHLGPMADRLPGSSPEFVKDQIKRYAQYGAGIRLSPRQWSWLDSLYEKNGGAAPKTARAMPDDEADPKDEIDDEIPF